MPGLHSMYLSRNPTPTPLLRSQPPNRSSPKLAAAVRPPGTATHFMTPLSGGGQVDPLLPLPDLPAQVKEKILCLEIMGVDSGRALALNPSLRAAPLDSLHSVVSYLLSKGIHHKDMARIFGMCPGALTADIHADLAPVFRFLARDLGVPAANFRRVVNKCPRLLVCSARDQLRPALLFLQRLGLRDTAALAYQDPVLLASSVERTLLPKVEYLALELGLGRRGAAAMVGRCPALLTFSVENNFRPKYTYLVGEMGRGPQEVQDFPQYFAFSLEKRIKPRHRDMEARRLRLPLPDMLKSTDDEFRALLDEAERRGIYSS
ncbi:hypothetical protein Taro_039686 [Colocasia esculenta]|uniref:Uncharacterized protein n=1 Tax=Colocasia esculenta TaxID=4460 RepID=A0A843WQV6_COLES|nr:hypothetical protein [Colocasia esculenta]